MDTRLLSIVGLLLVIFIGALLTNSNIVGYSSAKTLNEYPYEGFAQIQKKFEARDEKKQYAEALSPKEALSPEEEEAFEPMDEYEKKKFSEAFEPMDEYNSPAIKVAGFKGVQSGAFGNEKIIGFMYNNESNTSCKPFGYTNSKGNICMSPEDIKMLTTRGGNAGGASDQIGK